MNKEELNSILQQHKIWVESQGKKGQQANLEDVNLEHANLKGAILKDANLEGANLYDANLQGADLEHANLNDAGLEYANLHGANLACANLKYAFLYGAFLVGAKFSIEIKNCLSFENAVVSKDQLAWLALHSRFAEFLPTLKVK